MTTYFLLKLSLIFLLISSCLGNGQGQWPAPERSKATQAHVEYDAGDVTIKAFLDKNGNMWFTTLKEGVFMYDGKAFTHYTVENGLCDNNVPSIMETKDGVLWFGTASGLCRFDGKKFHPMPIVESAAFGDSTAYANPLLVTNDVMSLYEDKQGVFWVGTLGSGAYRYDGKQFTSFLKHEGRIQPNTGLHYNAIMSINGDTEGNVWLASFTHGGITKFDGKQLTYYAEKEGLEDDMIASSYLDPSGKLWFGTRSGGMSYLNGNTFTTIREKEGVCNNNMATMFQDSKGRFWVASFARSGVCWFDGTTFSPLKIEGSEKLIDIRCIAEDREGNIWLGGRYGLLWRYDGKTLTDFTQLKRG